MIAAMMLHPHAEMVMDHESIVISKVLCMIFLGVVFFFLLKVKANT